MKKMRYGLVGFGAWGQHHARAITECPAAELAAIAVRSAESQAEARRQYPAVAVVGSAAELLAQADVEIVDVVLPNSQHFPVGSQVLQAGKHLLLEKPMAVTLADCKALEELARTRNRLLAVGHEFRLSSLWGKAKEMIDDGAIGDPLYVLIELWRNPYRRGAEGWRYDIERVGSWILEEPIHFFDLARWYLRSAGDPLSIYARANSRQPGHPELHDNFSAIVNFPHGVYAVISQTLGGFEHHQVAKVIGTRGALWASWSGAMDRTFHPSFSLKHWDGETAREVPIEKTTGEVYELVDEITAVTAAARGGSRPPATGEDGRWSVAMCLRAQESVETGRAVSF